MRLHLPALIGALALLPAAGSALAQPAEAGIQIELGLLDSNDNFDPLDAFEREEILNQARCQCGIETPDTSQTPGPESFYIRLTLDAYDTTLSENAALAVGSNCDSDEREDRNCEEILTIGDVADDLRARPQFAIQIDRYLFPNETSCRETTGKRGIYLLFDSNDDDLYEKSSKVSYDFDTEPPPLPGNLEVSPGEGSVQIRWTAPQSRQDDVEYYQVLCARADGSPAFATPPDDPVFETAYALCDSSTTVPVQDPPASGVDGGTPVVDAGLPDASPDLADASGFDQGFQGGAVAWAVAPADLPAELAALDPAYVCATETAGALSTRVGELENGESYHLVLLAVDHARNVTAVALGEVTPEPVTDFWEEYQGSGGNAEGGVCLVTSTFGDDDPMTRALRDFRDRTLAGSAAGRALIDIYYAHVAPLGSAVDAHLAARVAAAAVLAPLAGLAAFWEYTGPAAKLLGLLVALGALLGLRALLRRRRARASSARASSSRASSAGAAALPEATPTRHGARHGARVRWPRLAVAAGAPLLVLAWSAPAYAQNDPYWEVFEPVGETASPVGPGIPHWNFGIKLGPYQPNVDSELGVMPGPYERTFGGAGLMGIIELERFFLQPLGQLGVTASVGTVGKTANALVPGDDGADPMRSTGEETSFRLIPMSAGIVYRFTALDDRWRIPLVPYARAGLSYYLWWITAPDGSIAEVPTADCPDLNGCDGNRALGASLGWQVSLGMSLRAERFDPQAELSLRNELGIEHAGLYAELVHASVDGFGSDTRLHVGDTTWFAGVNFEF